MKKVYSMPKEYWEQVYTNYYLKGESFSDIEKIININKTTIFRNFKKYNLLTRDLNAAQKECRKRPDDFWRSVYDEYKEYGGSLDLIAHKYHISENTLVPEFARLGLPLKSQSQIQKEILHKKEKTNLERYGKKCVLEVDEIKERIKQTNIERYGVENPLFNKDIKAKAITTIKTKSYEKRLGNLLPSLKKFNYELLDKFEGNALRVHKEHIRWKKYNIKHIPCGTVFQDDVFMTPRCPKCYPLNRSVAEVNLQNYIRSLGFDCHPTREIIKNPKTNLPLELDIYLPARNIAFEYNGVIYHRNKPVDYHAQKTDLCLEKGIKLFHVWEHHNPEIVKSRIEHILGVNQKTLNARDFEFKEIATPDANLFLHLYHLQGATAASAAYGLFDNEQQPVALMTFRRVLNNAQQLEIARFCSMPGYSIRGGFSKLFSNALNGLRTRFQDVTTIITYADKDWSPDYKETVYFKNGFEFMGDSGPSMFYVKEGRVYSRQNFQKYKLKAMFPDAYNDNLTEHQILSLKNIYPIYTSGNWKFKKVV